LAIVTLVIGIVAISLSDVIGSLLFRRGRKSDDEPQALAGIEGQGPESWRKRLRMSHTHRLWRRVATSRPLSASRRRKKPM
jgi:hypothetical protein